MKCDDVSQLGVEDRPEALDHRGSTLRSARRAHLVPAADNNAQGAMRNYPFRAVLLGFSATKQGR